MFASLSRTIALGAALALFSAPLAQAADLKQLAEQLVNLTTKEQPGAKPTSGSAAKSKASRCSGKSGNCGSTGSGQIAIQEEGANVKKEKGVEDVE
ncbi:MAG: hypothetical protein D6832_03885 [Alphaproteobacteria bacterium]|nr:MAG: hypothetical protein D6832_03885 [Alphaproteobacteria bacterium]